MERKVDQAKYPNTMVGFVFFLKNPFACLDYPVNIRVWPQANKPRILKRGL
jgi:hypothetical protein